MNVHSVDLYEHSELLAHKRWLDRGSMIVLIAPYSPFGVTSYPNLGAAAKIEKVVEALDSVAGEPIVLVNSAHNEEVGAPLRVSSVVVSGKEVIQLTPPTYKSRPKGKLINLLQIRRICDEVLKIGRPTAVWAYNGYAFESLLARLLKKRSAAKVILEFEDWHFARSRGLGVKPLVDWLCWRLLMPKVDFCFGVNELLLERTGLPASKTYLLPGVVDESVLALRDSKIPFSGERDFINIGYFGGLSAEKGAGIVLDLARAMPNRFRFLVTGGGAYAKRFEELSAANPEQVRYYGLVDKGRLSEIIGECDVLLNPHYPLEKMAGGVFPFKVLESVGSGRLLISTRLPLGKLQDALQGVCFVEHSVESFADAIKRAEEIYQEKRRGIERGHESICQRFSFDAFRRGVAEVL